MDLMAIVAMFGLSVALGLAGTRAILEATFSVMTHVRASHDSAHTRFRDRLHSSTRGPVE